GSLEAASRKDEHSETQRPKSRQAARLGNNDKGSPIVAEHCGWIRTQSVVGGVGGTARAVSSLKEYSLPPGGGKGTAKGVPEIAVRIVRCVSRVRSRIA